MLLGRRLGLTLLLFALTACGGSGGDDQGGEDADTSMDGGDAGTGDAASDGDAGDAATDGDAGDAATDGDAAADAGPAECDGQPDGLPCGDSACAKSCSAGVCVDTPPTCAVPSDPCRASGVCVPETGLCDFSALQGVSCDDGEVCSETDVCDANGTCGGVALPDQELPGCETDRSCVSGVCRGFPVVNDDVYEAGGNTARTMTRSVLANDVDPAGFGLSCVPASGATTLGGTFDLLADGTFTYTPPLGLTAMQDTFAYEAERSDGRTGMGTVHIELLGRYWYVDNTAAAGGDGSLGAPFNTLKAAESASMSADTIVVSRGDGTTVGYNEGLVMKPEQTLVGQGEAVVLPLSDGGQEVLPAGDRPLITRLTGPAVTLATDAKVFSVHIESPAAQGIYGRGSLGSLSVERVVVADAGVNALDVSHDDPSAATVQLADLALSSTAGVGNGALLVVEQGDVTVDARRLTVSGMPGDGLMLIAFGATAALDLTVEESSFDGQGGGDEGVSVAAGAGARLKCQLSKVNVHDQAGGALAVRTGGLGTATDCLVSESELSSTSSAVYVRADGDAPSDDFVTRLGLVNSTVASAAGQAVHAEVRDAGASGVLHLFLDGNTLSSASDLHDAVVLESRDANALCAEVTSNTVTASAAAHDFSLTNESGTFTLVGQGTSVSDALLAENNATTVSVDPSVTLVSAGTCERPAL